MKRDKIILLLLVVILGLEVMVLSIANRDLRKKVSKYEFILYQPGKLAENTRGKGFIPNLELRDLSTGTKRTLLDITGGKKFILMVFSTDCPACEQVVVGWNEIFDEYGLMYPVIGISTNDTVSIRDYVLRNGARFPVFRYEESGLFESFGSLPKTILVGQDGQIIESVDGVTKEVKNKIEEVITR